jgi:threonyl-tRNA synthetase
MTLNDGHIFCSPDQVEDEITEILGLVDQAYRALGIPAPSFRLSLKGDGPKYVGDGGLWQRGEALLRSALTNRGLAFEEAAGEAAFYGPKIDLQVHDPRGRAETLSTIQLDFHLPATLGLFFHRGAVREQPIMVHRSIVSTMERMVAHLLEVHDGALPVWLAPTQVVILPVVTDAVAYGRELRDTLRGNALRVEIDDRNASLGARIRDAERRHVPYVAVVGRRELDDGTVAVRLRDRRQLAPLEPASLVGAIKEAVASHSLNGDS